MLLVYLTLGTLASLTLRTLAHLTFGTLGSFERPSLKRDAMPQGGDPLSLREIGNLLIFNMFLFYCSTVHGFFI